MLTVRIAIMVGLAAAAEGFIGGGGGLRLSSSSMRSLPRSCSLMESRKKGAALRMSDGQGDEEIAKLKAKLEELEKEKVTRRGDWRMILTGFFRTL
eukprot:186605-Hanusia_phi.AAC.1